jgi:hypothetical protein
MATMPVARQSPRIPIILLYRKGAKNLEPKVEAIRKLEQTGHVFVNTLNLFANDIGIRLDARRVGASCAEVHGGLRQEDASSSRAFSSEVESGLRQEKRVKFRS